MKADRDTIITTVYVVIDTLCKKVLSTPPQKQKLTDAEVVTIAICSALFFRGNHQAALVWLRSSGYFPQMLSLSRFNRRIHRLKDFIEFCFEVPRLYQFALLISHRIPDTLYARIDAHCQRLRIFRCLVKQLYREWFAAHHSRTSRIQQFSHFSKPCGRHQWPAALGNHINPISFHGRIFRKIPEE